MTSSVLTLPSTFPVTCHTDYVGQGSTFVVIKGQQEEGSRYISLALEKGATKIVVEQSLEISEDTLLEIAKCKATLHKVDNARASLAFLSAEAAGYPAQKLRILGITGTKGKTTTSHILFNLLHSAGHKTALVSTVVNRIGDTLFPAPLTTPQPDYLHQFFKLCAQQEVEFVVMEVAAQAMTFNRIETLTFDGLIFTNLDREHGELYPTMDDYFAAKKALFNYAKSGAPVLINVDDVYGRKLLQENSAYKSYSMLQNATFLASCNVTTKDMPSCTLEYAHKKEQFTYSTFVGIFNGYNIIAAVSLCLSLGISLEDLRKGLLALPSLAGRLEEYTLPNGARVFIDYAHTPASFQALFSTARCWTDHLIVLFGAGGGKDKEKRPLMGAIAVEYADKVFVTTDNPRHEDAAVIAQEIVAGIQPDLMGKVFVEPDREKAIKAACHFATPDTVILLLGKGPDEYQMVGTTKHFFSEKTILRSLIASAENDFSL